MTISRSKKQVETKLSKIKTNFTFPKKEKYIGSHIKSKLGDEYASNESYEKYYKNLV
jgi:hypothetical protein